MKRHSLISKTNTSLAFLDCSFTHTNESACPQPSACARKKSLKICTPLHWPSPCIYFSLNFFRVKKGETSNCFGDDRRSRAGFDEEKDGQPGAAACCLVSATRSAF